MAQLSAEAREGVKYIIPYFSLVGTYKKIYPFLKQIEALTGYDIDKDATFKVVYRLSEPMAG